MRATGLDLRPVVALPGRRTGGPWPWLALAEVALGAAIVIGDILIPTLVILLIAAVSLGVRREGPATLGFQRTGRPWRVAAEVLLLTVGWTVVQLAVIMPALNHATGQKQDLSDFAELEGDLGLLVVLLVVSWTIAAFGEEIVYRGYLFTRVTDVLGSRAVAVLAAAVLSSILFGLAHTEQGALGIVITFLDGLFFCALRLHYRTLIAPVLAHGFNNTIGLVSFFLVGPVYGLW